MIAIQSETSEHNLYSFAYWARKFKNVTPEDLWGKPRMLKNQERPKLMRKVTIVEKARCLQNLFQ